jgi:hypothetical protein
MKLWLTANTGVEGLYNCVVTTGNYNLTLETSLNSASNYNNKQPTQFYVSQGTNKGSYMRSVAIDGITIQIDSLPTILSTPVATSYTISTESQSFTYIPATNTSNNVLLLTINGQYNLFNLTIASSNFVGVLDIIILSGSVNSASITFPNRSTVRTFSTNLNYHYQVTTKDIYNDYNLNVRWCTAMSIPGNSIDKTIGGSVDGIQTTSIGMFVLKDQVTPQVTNTPNGIYLSTGTLPLIPVIEFGNLPLGSSVMIISGATNRTKIFTVALGTDYNNYWDIVNFNIPVVNSYANLNALPVADNTFATLSTYDIDTSIFYNAGLYYKTSNKWQLVSPNTAVALNISAFSQTPIVTTGASVIRGWPATPGKLVWLNAPNQAGGIGLWRTSATAWDFLCTSAGFTYDQTLIITDSLDEGIRYQISVYAGGTRDVTKINNSFITCQFASTPNVAFPLTGIPDKDFTDQYTVQDGDIGLIWQQSASLTPEPQFNGVYIVNAAGAWTRHPQFDTWAKLQYLTAVVQYGQQASGYTFYTNIPATGTLNITAITIWKSTQNSSIIFSTDFALSTSEIPNNSITSVNCLGYPNPQASPIALPYAPETDDYCIIFHGGGNAIAHPLYIINNDAPGYIDLGNYGGITNAGFILKNNGFNAKFVYVNYGVKPIKFYGDISTTNAFIENIDPVLLGGYLPLVIGQEIQYSALSNFFPAGTTITNIDVGSNKITVSNNANITGTSRFLTAILWNYATNPAWVLTDYSYQANEVQGVTYVASNGGSDTFGQINNFGQPFATIQAGFDAMPSGDQLEVYPNNITGYDAGLTITTNAIGTEVFGIGDNVIVPSHDLVIIPAIGASISALSFTGIYWNDLNVVSTDGNIDGIYFRNGGFNNATIDLAGTTNTGYLNNFYFDGTLFIGALNILPVGFAKQLVPIRFYFNNCSWENNGLSSIINLNGTQVILVLQNCNSIPQTINYLNGATSAQIIINKIPVYNFTKGFNATGITAGAITLNNGTNDVSGGLTTNATSITLLKNNTYLINAEITVNLSGSGAVTLALALATGDTTSTIYTQSYTTTVNGQHQISLQAIFKTANSTNGAVSIVASGITNTVDILASSNLNITTYNTFLT